MWAHAVALALVIAGCDDGTGDSDASTDAGAVDGSVVPPGIAPPAEPSPPDIVDAPTCATGFSATSTDPSFCEPWPAGSGRCPSPHEARFPGDPDCAPVAPCPSGDFADGLPASGVVYVRAGESGDGSLGAPFGTIRDAIAAVARPGVVAVGPGSYDEAVTLPDGVSLVGVCPERATIAPSTFSASAAVTVAGVDVVVRNLSISAPRRPGVEITGRGAARLEGVVVRDVYSSGIIMSAGASLETDGVIIAEVAAPSGSFGGGLEYVGATIDLSRTLIEDVNGIGIFASAGSTLIADGLVVRDVRDGVGLGAGAIQAQDATTLTISRSVVEETQTTFAVVGNGAGATVHLESSIVRTNRAPGSRAASGGVQALDGATVTLTLSTLRDFDGLGASASGGTLELTDAIIDSVLPSSSDPEAFAGAGIEVRDGSQLSARRTRVTNVTSMGLQLEASTALLEDLVVRDVPGLADIPLTGRGIQISGGAEATLTRVLVDGTGNNGIYVGQDGSRMMADDIVVLRSSYRGIALELGATAEITRVTVDETRQASVIASVGSSLVLSDATIRRSAARADGRFGRAINVQDSTATLSRIAIDGYASEGLFVAGPTASVELEDTFIANGEGGADFGTWGEGITCQAGALVSGSRVAVHRAREAGVLAISGGRIELVDLEVRETRERACAGGLCSTAPMGFGVAAVDGTVTLRDFEIVRSPLCGAFVAGASEVDFATGRVAGSQIGACVQAPGFDVGRITNDVVYEENETNLDATMLPLPESPDST